MYSSTIGKFVWVYTVAHRNLVRVDHNCSGLRTILCGRFDRQGLSIYAPVYTSHDGKATQFEVVMGFCTS